MKKIYILHGWAYSTEKWEPFVDLLKGKGLEPVLLKIPGLTASLTQAWTLDDYVEWLKENVSNLPAGRQEEKVILLGHSNGGRISLAFALKYPEKVSQLILIDSAGIYHNEFPLRVKRFVFKNLVNFKKIAYNTVLKNVLYKLVRETDYNKASPLLKKTMQNLIESDLTNQLQEIQIPTTIIWGEHDMTTPVTDGKLMSEKIKSAKLFIIKNARHSPQFTHGKEVVEIVVKAIK